MTENQIDLMLSALDGYAQGVDNFQYGLPLCDDEHFSAMREIVKERLALAASPAVAVQAESEPRGFFVTLTRHDGQEEEHAFATASKRDDWLEAEGFENFFEFRCWSIK